jgi:hypothetical protein
LVRAKSSITLELDKSGQTITLGVDEAKQVIKNLARLLNKTRIGIGRKKRAGRMVVTKKRRQKRKNNKMTKKKGKILSMSETKRQEIMEHVYRQLSARPKTLSALLKGISYSPNYLPMIRKLVESRGNISHRMIGKRTYYARKGSGDELTHSPKQSKIRNIMAA